MGKALRGLEKGLVILLSPLSIVAITFTHIMPSPAVLLISEDSVSEGHKRKRRAVHRILHSDADLAAAVHAHGFSSGCAANALRPNWNGV